METSQALSKCHVKHVSNSQQAKQNLEAMGYCLSDGAVIPRRPLSVRECEILQLSANGLSNPEIASILCISRHTVKSHLDHIYNKLGVANRTMAVVWAVRQGLI